MRRLAFLSLLLLSACAPVEQARVPVSAEPQIRGDRFITETGDALPLRAWLPKRKPKAVLVALHGFNDYSRAFEVPAWFFNGKGIAVYAYDQRGFGANAQPGIWPGGDGLVADLKSFVRVVRKRHAGVPVFLLGESMGGAVVLSALAEPDMPKVSGVILSAPAVWGEEAMNPFFRASLWLMAHSWPSYKLTGEDLKILATSNLDVLRQMSSDPLIIKATRVDAIYGLVGLMDRATHNADKAQGKMVVLYGARDEVIPSQALSGLQSRLQGKAEFSCYPQGYHLLLRDLDADIVLHDIAEWTAKPGSSMPSGGEDKLALCRLKESGS